MMIVRITAALFCLFFFPAYSAVVAPQRIVGAKDYLLKHPEAYIFFKTGNSIPFTPHPILGTYFCKWLNFFPTFVLKIENGKIFGKEGVVISSENEVLKESAFNWSFNEQQHPIFSLRFLPNSVFYDADIASISFVSASNYYHWMLDILPKIKLLEEYQMDPALYYIDYQKLRFQTETLSTLGILHKILPAQEKTHIQARNIIFPSTPEAHVGCPPLWAIEFLREKFLDVKVLTETKKIYITRRKTQFRRVINENELIGFLKNYGFTILCLEDYSVKEQAAFFYNAEIIVGPHGAGLTNIIFCNPNVKIIEIFPPNYCVPCYWNISQLMNLKHICIQCLNKPTENYDIVVDFNQLANELK